MYEVYALRYATHDARSASENFIFDDFHDDENMPLDFYSWVIKKDKSIILVDTGFDQETAKKRGRHYFGSPTVMLSDLGISPEEVTDIVITHMHYDHCGNIKDFPNAKFHIQDAEMEYCTGRCMCHASLRKPFEQKDVIEAIKCLFEDRLIFHKGDYTLCTGVNVHLVGGHTRGLQIVEVLTSRGNLVLASDAAHYWKNIVYKSPFPIVLDVGDMLDAHIKIESLVGNKNRIIPGHDPLVNKFFPKNIKNQNILNLHEEPILEVEL
ncbi:MULTISPECIES: N-acyl homoserine lactonase family protein [Comamonas]|uniref:N-acyl homoserine lactonase family protein n=1 Tax=Comamonas TaxID=283 RepID=UPI0009B880A6|nr:MULTISPECIES: N-acyl homoserine lactonase family protein [Comamonas]MPT09132.1 N-acyl homoserine lactonase family protein [Comamonas sp.]